MDCEDFVSYNDIEDGLEYHELSVRRLWELLRQFKKECWQAFAIRSIQIRWNRSTGGPLEVKFFCDSATQVPSLSMVSAIVNNHFELLLFPVSSHTFALCLDPDSGEFTHFSFGLRISYWSFSSN